LEEAIEKMKQRAEKSESAVETAGKFNNTILTIIFREGIG
jgi:hypothetical protein